MKFNVPLRTASILMILSPLQDEVVEGIDHGKPRSDIGLVQKPYASPERCIFQRVVFFKRSGVGPFVRVTMEMLAPRIAPY